MHNCTRLNYIKNSIFALIVGRISMAKRITLPELNLMLLGAFPQINQQRNPLQILSYPINQYHLIITFLMAHTVGWSKNLENNHMST